MEDFIKIAIIDNEIEAQILDDILTEREIPHVLESYYDQAYGELFQFQKGWGSIYAPNEYRQEIEEIIADLRKGTYSDTEV